MAKHGMEIYNTDGSFKTDFTHYMFRLISVFRVTEPGDYMFPAPLSSEPAVLALMENPGLVVLPGRPNYAITPFDWELIASGGLYTGIKAKYTDLTNTATVFYVWAMGGTSTGQHGLALYHPGGDIVIDGEHIHPSLFTRNTYTAPSDSSASFLIEVPRGKAVVPLVNIERGSASTHLIDYGDAYGVSLSLGIDSKAELAVYVA